MIDECERCGNPVRVGGRGRPQRFCSAACKQAAYRARQSLFDVPQEMRFRRRWTRRDGKRPVQVDGRPASSTSATTWASFEQVAGSKTGDGLGFMLGDGIGCIDLDHCLVRGELAVWAREVLETAEDVIFVERSLSGTGLHIFQRVPEARGRIEVTPDGGRIERFSRARFIAVTGDRWGGWNG